MDSEGRYFCPVFKTRNMTHKAKRATLLNGTLWTIQVLLAIMLVWAAAMKLLQPAAELALMWPWTATHRGQVTATGILDLLAAIGLVLPAALRIRPVLTVYAACGIIALMVAAACFHIARGETGQIGLNITVAAMAGFVVWGRGRKNKL